MKARARLKYVIISLLLIFAMLPVTQALASDTEDSEATGAVDLGFSVDARGAILIEAETGTVLFEQNADAAYPPASVTKIMTLLLVMEALESGKIALTDRISVSEYAASMGGSQVFLEAGEAMTVEEMIKCTVIASANDAAVALAEYVSGSEGAFVAEMNRRAEELGMTATHFENVTGLDDTTENHVTSASDIAKMSRELIKHDLILKYSSVWMDSIRDGAFTLTNTNRLIRYYEGATGLKTGSTEKAKFCISACATRGGMTLIAVIMGAPTRDARNEAARRLLDYGFSNYALYRFEGRRWSDVPVLGGSEPYIEAELACFSAVVKKSELSGVVVDLSLPEKIAAPVCVGDEIGSAVIRTGETHLATMPIRALTPSPKMNYWQVFLKLLQRVIFSHEF